jgi:hypothetical protein
MVAAINRMIPVAKEIGYTSLKGACIGAGIGISFTALIYLQQDAICTSASDPRTRWVCYLHTEIGKYIVVPVYTYMGFVSGAAYGTYKLIVKKQD